MKTKINLGLYFSPKIDRSIPFSHRLWKGYNIFIFDFVTREWNYNLTRTGGKISKSDNTIVIKVPRITKRREVEIKCKLSEKMYNLLNEEYLEWQNINSAELEKREFILSAEKNKNYYSKEARNEKTTIDELISSWIFALPTNVVLNSDMRDTSPKAIFKTLNAAELDELLFEICKENNKTGLLEWINQEDLSEQYCETHTYDASVAVEMLSEIDVTKLYETLGLKEVNK